MSKEKPLPKPMKRYMIFLSKENLKKPLRKRKLQIVFMAVITGHRNCFISKQYIISNNDKIVLQLTVLNNIINQFHGTPLADKAD